MLIPNRSSSNKHPIKIYLQSYNYLKPAPMINIHKHYPNLELNLNYMAINWKNLKSLYKIFNLKPYCNMTLRILKRQDKEH